jgi:enoyl-CoA hydratase/carnithine racemase
MSYERLKLLKVRVDRQVAFVTIDSPPINIMNGPLLIDLNRFAVKVAKDDGVKVIVFDSADPDFFIAHFDVEVLSKAPSQAPPKPKQLSGMHPLLESFRTMPKVSIAKIEGRCRGGGSEFVLALDMRFGAVGKAIMAQPEVLVGIIPGGGSTQRLPRLIGRGRALEVVLSGMDLSAEVAERYGYINRALPPDELTPFVEKLAYRIATFPAETIALAKKAVLAAEELPLLEGLLEETYLFNQSTALPAAKEIMKRFLEKGGQTREVELDFSKLLEELEGERRDANKLAPDPTRQA